MIILQNKMQALSIRRTYVYDISMPTPHILNGHSATDRKLYRCAAKNESTLAQSFTMDEFGAGTLSLCRVEEYRNQHQPTPLLEFFRHLMDT